MAKGSAATDRNGSLAAIRGAPPLANLRTFERKP